MTDPLETALQSSQKHATELWEKMCAAEAEVKEARGKLAASETNLEAARDEFKRLEYMAQEIAKERGEALAKLAEQAKRIQELEQRAGEWAAHAGESDGRIVALEARERELVKELEAAKAAYKQFYDLANQHAKSLADSLAQIAALQSEKSLLTEEVNKLRAHFNDGKGNVTLLKCWYERELENERAEKSQLTKALEKKEADRQYHMNAINKIAEPMGMLGETSEAIADAAFSKIARLACVLPVNEGLAQQNERLTKAVEEAKAAHSEVWAQMERERSGRKAAESRAAKLQRAIEAYRQHSQPWIDHACVMCIGATMVRPGFLCAQHFDSALSPRQPQAERCTHGHRDGSFCAPEPKAEACGPCRCGEERVCACGCHRTDKPQPQAEARPKWIPCDKCTGAGVEEPECDKCDGRGVVPPQPQPPAPEVCGCPRDNCRCDDGSQPPQPKEGE